MVEEEQNREKKVDSVAVTFNVCKVELKNKKLRVEWHGPCAGDQANGERTNSDAH